MANETAIHLGEEFQTFAAPYVESGRFHNAEDVMHAAMDAFRLSQFDEEALNKVFLELAEEGEASGDAEGDIFQTIRAKYGLRSALHR
jgi:putative addiction module CopG family antidote